MRFIIGIYAYLTKISIIDLKSKLKIPYSYKRDIYDYILISPDDKTKVKITQDGLIYIDSEGSIDDIDKWIEWIKIYIINELDLLDDEDIFYKTLFEKKPPTIIFIFEKEEIESSIIFKKFNRVSDYSIQTTKLSKEYGDGLIIFKKVKLTKEQVSNLIEYQIILSDYQNLVRYLLNENKNYWMDISKIRKQEKYIFKDIPELVDNLLDKRRNIDSVIHRIKQLDETLLNREVKCPIKNILHELKLDDFGEMIRLNSYITDQFEMTKDYVSSTIELIQLIYQENEQKELNILQVIFAIGTIASLVSLAGISDDEIVITQEAGKMIGQMHTFDIQSMIFWTGISIVIGVISFVVLNYLFLHAKKLRIVQLIKKK